MPHPPRLHQRLQHLQGLWLRTRTSLRQRGLRATLARIRERLAPPVQGHAAPLWFPQATTAIAFADVSRPKASLIIPVYGQLPATLRCLRALAEAPPETMAEIIVVDDASPDGSADALAALPGLRLVRRRENGGFVRACNSGAEVARGEYLVFLNNDTVPQPGWLEALLQTFARYPDTGLVGAQLVYPDGRLQEAGGRVFRDGSAANHGRFAARNHPRHACVQEADYCSGAAIALPTALFRRLGGFDLRYAPAYYEDTDLALQVRASGHAVRMQPFAVVVHEEGTTAGTDLGSGAKSGQVRNQAVFAQKWADTLAQYPANGDARSLPQAWRGRRQILFIDAHTPRPDRDSASLRLFNLMQMLVAEGACVSFLPDDLAHAGEATHALQAAGIEAWYAPFIGKREAWVKSEVARFDTIVLSRHHVAQRWLPLLRRHAPQARVLFDSVDLHYLRERRAAEISGNAAGLAAAEKTRQRELAVMAASDLTLVVSAAERALLARDAPEIPVEIISNLHHLAEGGLPFAERRDLVFVGGFRHPPNVDAVQWLAAEIHPRVRAALGDVTLHLIGADAPAGIIALGRQPGIHLHGYIPDITPWMNGARIALAPLRFGAGVKGKVNLSMAHGQPVVATSCAIEGMHLRHLHDVLVADSSEDFAAAIIRLYQDPALWQALAENGRENIRRHFSVEAARDTVRRVLLG